MRKLLAFLGCLAPCFFFVVEMKAQNRNSVSGAEVTGTFRTKDGDEFKILALGKGKLRVAFSGTYAFKTRDGGNMANSGEARGTASIEGDTSVFKPEETEQCTITLKFLSGGRLQVKQSGSDAECGFGANVSASGTYKKVSGKNPKFEQSNK